MKFTQGKWSYACDSYGRVQHSRKYDCVFSHGKDEAGRDFLITVASRIQNSDDAKLIRCAPEMYRFVKAAAERGDPEAREIVRRLESNQGVDC